MKNQRIVILSFLFLCLNVSLSLAQNIGINTTGATPDSSAMLDIASSDKGLLIPRLTTMQRDGITGPATGLMVFNTTDNQFNYYNGTTWEAIGGGSDNLGNHIASQNLQLNNNWFNNDGGANEGIYVDTAGQVGVGTTPSAKFHVSMGKVSEVNASMTSSDFFFTVDVCQSFTPTKNGELQSIELATSGTAAVTYNLYEGQGTGGTLIAGPLNQANPQAPYLFSGVTLTQGQQYTIEVLNPTAMAFSIDHFSDYYSGGQACNDLNADYWFKVNLLVDKPGVRIDDSQIQLNDYSLPITDGTAGQSLQTNGAGTVSWASPAVDMDQQNLSLSGTVLYLTNDATPVDLSGLLSNTDNQDLSLSSNTLSLTNDGTPVDLSGYLDNTDAQDLSLSGNTLSLTNDGTSVDLSGYLDNTDTDEQDLSLSSNTLSLTNDATSVDLSGYLDNTDAQDLSLSGNTLSLTNDGTSVDLSGYLDADNLGNHTATQNLQLNGNWLNNDGGADKGINVDNTGQVGINTTPAATFHVDMGAAQTVNPISITHNGTTNAITFDYQTFTSTINGPLDSISIYFTTGLDPVRYRLYEGEGLTNLMYQNDVVPISGENTFTFPGISLQKNQIYTLSLAFFNTSSTTFYYNSTNPYSGGITNSNAGWDMDFKVYMTQGNSGFRVSNSGVTINEYSLPSTDGNADQVLTTDGAGNVSWSSAAGGGADNLGNHTATQNLVLGSNRLTNTSGSSDGLSIDSNGAVDVETTYGRPALFKTTAANEGSFIEVQNAEGTRAIFGAGGNALIPGVPNDVAVGNWSNGYLRLYTNGSTKIYVDALGKTGIGRVPITNLLEVEGNASKTSAGSWIANSDARLKKNITPLSSSEVLNKMLSLQGVTYEWNDTQTGTKRPEGIQFGFTAQNIQEVFPSLVTEDNNGFLQTPYGTYDAMTVEAIRALNDKIEKLENEKTTLQSQVDQLQSQNQQFKTNTTELANLKSAFIDLKALLKKNNLLMKEEAIEIKK